MTLHHDIERADTGTRASLHLTQLGCLGRLVGTLSLYCRDR